MIHPGKLDAIIHGLSARFGVEAHPLQPGLYTTERGERKEPGYRVVGSVGVLDIFGVLAHRGGVTADSSYILGYQQIAQRLEAALADPQIRSIVLNIDSPGGEVGGAFDLADQIYSARGTKPIHAIAGDVAASAAYLIGSAADELSVIQTGHIGSIGVVMRHADWSKALTNEGVDVTHIFAGAHKIDGNAYEPLPEAVRDRFQAEIEKVYSMFVGAVARHTGLTDNQVRGTEALVYMGADGVEQGLASRIETPDELISRLQAEHGGASSRHFMTTQEADMAKEEKSAEDVTQAASEEQAAALVAAKAKAHDAGCKAGAEAERTRIAAILDSEEAQGREAQAKHFAFSTAMAADDVKAALAAGAAAVPVSAKTPLETAMASEEQPQIGAEGEAGELSAAQQILSDHKAATGRANKE